MAGGICVRTVHRSAHRSQSFPLLNLHRGIPSSVGGSRNRETVPDVGNSKTLSGLQSNGAVCHRHGRELPRIELQKKALSSTGVPQGRQGCSGLGCRLLGKTTESRLFNFVNAIE